MGYNKYDLYFFAGVNFCSFKNKDKILIWMLEKWVIRCHILQIFLLIFHLNFDFCELYFTTVIYILMGVEVLSHTFKGNSDMFSFEEIYSTLSYFSIPEWMQKIFQFNIYYCEKYTLHDTMYSGYQTVFLPFLLQWVN